MDDVGAWHVEPTLRTGLRLTRTRNLFDAGELEDAVIEAEELLGEEPEHAEALLLLGEALLGLGDAEGAVDALSHHLSLAPASPRALGALTVAQFEVCALVDALTSGRECVRLAPDNAEAHYYLGLSLERLGQTTTGARHFIAAHQLAPDSFPFPIVLHAEDWTRLLSKALQQLPESLADFWDGVDVAFLTTPDLNELRSADPPISPTVYGLYRDSPPPEDELRPQQLRFFTTNLARCREQGEIVEAMLETLSHEALAWLGLPGTPDLELS